MAPDTLEELLQAHPEVDFIQLQVNYLDWESPVVQARRNMEIARKYDKPVVVMEPARGGRLADLPKPWPRRFWPLAPTLARCRGRTASASTSPTS